MAAPPIRETMHQAFVPFVEMYMHGVDVLRSTSGKPRSLISFSHDIYDGSPGFWTLELFDPGFTSVEELLVSTVVGVDGTAIDQYGTKGGAQEDEEYIPVSSARFRYGYVGKDESEIVVSRGPGGAEFFYGSVHSYVPVYEPNGTRLIIRGDSGGSKWKGAEKGTTHFENMSVYSIIKFICEERKWKLTPLGKITDQDIELELGKQPSEFKRVDTGVDNTEEHYPAYTMRKDESHLDFINRLCISVRPNEPKYEPFIARLEFRCKSKDDTPKGYLYFGPGDYIDQDPVRQYTYMRDAKSDIISFSNNAQVYAEQLTGASGLVYVVDDSRIGILGCHTLTDLPGDRSMKYDTKLRSVVKYGVADVEAYAKGEAEDEENKDKPEGGRTGSQQLAGEVAPSVGEPQAEMTVATNDRRQGDQEVMNHWLSMQQWVQTGQLQIFGDPSSDIEPGRLITILVFVPDAEDSLQMKFHWTSSNWTILGVNHEINHGSMVTNMELARTGFEHGGITSTAAVKEITDRFSPGQRKRTA